jgi:hypothetical protein
MSRKRSAVIYTLRALVFSANKQRVSSQSKHKQAFYNFQCCDYEKVLIIEFPPYQNFPGE